jgi:hypothetical protein
LILKNIFSKIFFILLTLPLLLNAQNRVKVDGIVLAENHEPISNVIIKVQSSSSTAKTDSLGKFTLELAPGLRIINFKLLGYFAKTVQVKLIASQDFKLETTLRQDLKMLAEVKVEDKISRNQNMVRLNPKLVNQLPSVSGNFESILKQLPGVSVNNELSSQYSVRGGNFDENLIYINDIEIYKPFLIRNGQQEGLSLINPDLVNNVKFSAGGFGARYGDKLSSVLDIQYKNSDTTRFQIGLGSNGVSATAFSGPGRLKYAFGFRQKQNKFILNSQPVVGSYDPQFYDFQSLLSYDISKKFSVQALGIYNTSRFGIIPLSQTTEFGTLQQVLRLKIDYEGQEIDSYNNVVGALTLNYKPHNNLNFKWINSAFFITEKETFDIYGSYVFEEINNDFGGQNFGQVKSNRGIGAYQNYGRNQLEADVYSSELRMLYSRKKSFWEAGFRLQKDAITDRVKEFSLSDSAGFILPNNSNEFILTESVEAKNQVNTTRYSGFVENNYEFGKFNLTSGLRAYYNNFTNEFIPSPRAVLTFKPNPAKDLIYRLASGLYTQQPFYREMRLFDGTVYQQSKSQRSIHIVGSSDYKFRGLGTDLKFSVEAYYKILRDLVPYKIENLRIRYYANQLANGYATGLDMRINGEFIEGLESSFRLSLMKTAEDIVGDSRVVKDANGNTTTIYPGYINRPTDQRVNFSAFFQDRLLKSPTYKVHINLLYGSALPIGPPKAPRYDDVFKIPAYRRMDIGFSKNILDPNARHQPKLFKKYLDSFIIYAEVFNLLNINNTVSYLWITDVDNTQYAIPNFLTARQLNVRLIAKF